MKPTLTGSVTDNTHLDHIDFKCMVLFEPCPQFLYSNWREALRDYDKIIMINGCEPPPINNIRSILESQDLDSMDVYTFDEELLNNFPKFKKFIFGTCWVLTNENGNMVNTRAEYFDFFKPENKNFKVSYIRSDKNCLEGHRLRHQISFDDCACEILYPKYRIDTKIPLFVDSMFHISIENSKYANYFTEKIIDCFMSKTIPIYWGCPNISEYFNPDGIITFETPEELTTILRTISPTWYQDRLPVILENYERSKEYAFIWDRLNNMVLS